MLTFRNTVVTVWTICLSLSSYTLCLVVGGIRYKNPKGSLQKETSAANFSLSLPRFVGMNQNVLCVKTDYSELCVCFLRTLSFHVAECYT
jgi:hypothetical protein